MPEVLPMPSSPAVIKQSDLTRYIAATVKAGVPVQQVMIAPDGTVTITIGNASAEGAMNPCDRLLD
ncbi:hypothetical protein N8I71_15770 [Roseibacterium sp. SDUM158016]|jgi:hypothetical protein|uniref:hypothetical protein n=1 Tax=Roseicyclus sediminis TaxID=2980997 RepID=UPI0021CFD910|nr:hypothetical protein [Roseibacterium sp. SDUM158016]MCU4654299.1 hypothetical protein [Roseibacterium sp. SDUM158016]